MTQFTDEQLLSNLQSGESEIYTLADIHKLLMQRDMHCSIGELRGKILPLYRDGYLGKEPTQDGVHMYYLIYNPAVTTEEKERTKEIIRWK